MAIVVVVQWAARNPNLIEGALLTILEWINARRRKPADHGAVAVHQVVEQAEAVDLSKRQLSKAFAFSLLNWAADIGCLWAAANAVGAEHSIGGLCIAYVTGKIVATVPVTPGGLGTVEFALITAMTAGGLGAHQAFAAVFVYRIVSFVLVALVGWVVFFLFYRGSVEVDPDAAPGEGTPSDESVSSSSSLSEPSDPSDPQTPAADPAYPRAPVVPAPPAGISAMWPLKGDQWRPTVPRTSGPIPLLGVRDRRSRDVEASRGGSRREEGQ